MATELLIQKTIHALEEGKFKVWIYRALALFLVLGLSCYFLIFRFNGLASSQAMDQAQIGRQIASGHGWSTQFIRPLAVGKLQLKGKSVPDHVLMDTYQALLPPLVDALALRVAGKASWKCKMESPIYRPDQAIALFSVFFFVAAVGVFYRIATELFDRFLAAVACGMVLVCEMMWRYSLSGLPQMLLLFLFSLSLYALIRAIKAHYIDGHFLVWLGATGLGFGLMALTHALTLWIFFPVVVFTPIYFRPRLKSVAVLLAVFLLVYTPWLIRNYRVCGSPFGMAILSVMDGIAGPESVVMRNFSLDTHFTLQAFFHKVRGNLVDQFNSLFDYLGWSFVAPVALFSLLHPFRRPVTALVRWLLLAMWLGAVLGMAAFGLPAEQGVAANQLHLLFVPLLTAYGLAVLITQWNQLLGSGSEEPRWNAKFHRLLRNAGIGVLFLLNGMPLLFGFMNKGSLLPVRWPPYIPFYIGMLGEWMTPDEVIASDMPWAVAWYSDRRSLWVPLTVNEFNRVNDYNILGAPVNGLYLTPISGCQNTMGDIFDGNYKEWAPMILRNWDRSKFPLHWAVIHGMRECLFLSDHDRRVKASSSRLLTD